ncbi:hypothetical protein KGM_209024 [Danaus plexippus plexippus]|uniref:DUF4757 domain-containing protein n=1 Tax=Danaus plexippus plexippus TaxID=278856 RepID=A0A212EW33_DANPL|nr:hypothetical protein KGM_209024 [Danaus plexippus plexippus]
MIISSVRCRLCTRSVTLQPSNNTNNTTKRRRYTEGETSDSADFLATRPHTASVLPGKPAANPLQFVKVGPADLGTKAREQLRRAELAKKTEPARIERQEDWQSKLVVNNVDKAEENLDNWKSSRRKRVEHIIERCVEVRRFENEIQPRGKSKTFNEMLEERFMCASKTTLSRLEEGALPSNGDSHRPQDATSSHSSVNHNWVKSRFTDAG